MVSQPEEGGLKDAIYEQNNIIISDSMLRNILPHQINKMYALYKVMCGCVCCISTKIMHSRLLSWQVNYLKNLNNKATMCKTECLVKWKVIFLNI